MAKISDNIVKANCDDVIAGDQSRGMDRHNVLCAGCSLFLGLDILRPFDRGTFIIPCRIHDMVNYGVERRTSAGRISFVFNLV